LPGESPAGLARLTPRGRAHDAAAKEGSAMIIQDQGDQIVIIRQTDHAVLSGFFARELGNEVFSQPAPMESFRLAATEHDNGWGEWEQQPCIDPVTFSPYTFMSIPTEEHIALYQRGNRARGESGSLRGLLVSMHCANLYDRTRATMPGFSASTSNRKKRRSSRMFCRGCDCSNCA